jgi:hypothetical protein
VALAGPSLGGPDALSWHPRKQSRQCRKQGFFYLNIPNALNSTVTATQYALSPTLSQDSEGNVYIDTNTIWGDRAIWGTGVSDLRAVWGTSSSAVDLTSTALDGEN